MNRPSLSAHGVEVLYGVIAELKSRGVGIVYITHKFEELARICDDVTIMRDGRVVGEALFTELTRDDIVRLMAGREAARGVAADARRTRSRAAPVAAANQLTALTKRRLRFRSQSRFTGELLSAEEISLPGEGWAGRFSLRTSHSRSVAGSARRLRPGRRGAHRAARVDLRRMWAARPVA